MKEYIEKKRLPSTLATYHGDCSNEYISILNQKKLLKGTIKKQNIFYESYLPSYS